MPTKSWVTSPYMADYLKSFGTDREDPKTPKEKAQHILNQLPHNSLFKPGSTHAPSEGEYFKEMLTNCLQELITVAEYAEKHQLLTKKNKDQ